MTPEERVSLYLQSFSSDGGEAVIGRARISYIVEALTGGTAPLRMEQLDEPDLQELAWGFESLGLEALRSEHSDESLTVLFEKAFQLRSSSLATGDSLSLSGLWLFIASGIASHNQPQLRQLLDDLNWEQQFGQLPERWDDRVLWECSRALFYLTRKRDGWQDIDSALAALRNLVELQREFQLTFLQGVPDGTTQIATYSRLVGLYHLAEGLTTLGEYLRTGSPESVLVTVERNTEHCRFLLRQSGDDSLAEIGDVSTLVLPQLVKASIWFNTSRLSEAARQFARRLTEADGHTPVLELWWAQREALAQNLLDPYKVAIGVQMPTSAGKTLLAEFVIVQTLALNPSSTVAYIVPTRALVSEVTRRLRADLGGGRIGIRAVSVESAVPVFEIDPTENAMLADRPDVLVTTPEKLDLLVRSAHPAVSDIVLVVVDEAHHIAEPGRGPKLELLLATMKRERGTSCRYLLLTPFLPNASELARWLGDEAYAAISLEWRPSLQLRALAHWKRRNKKYYDSLELVPSHSQPPEWQGVEIELGESLVQPATKSRPGISASVAVSLSKAGSSTLVLTRGQKTAEDRALEISAIVQAHSLPIPTDSTLDDVVSYVASEMGDEYPLTKTLRMGIGFHHAGLPPEVRTLVEGLLAKGTLRILTGTTTLAQGVNFPLANVIVETLQLPQGRGRPYRDLQFSEFWNIAGRAGRALKDRIGTVIWPSTSPKEDKLFTEYLEGEATAIVSALADALSSLDDAAPTYGLELVRNQPALSHFLQYLVHALRVGGFAQASAEIEDILRSSLVFHRLRLDDRDSAERLIRWSRRFLEATRDRPLLDVADSTGLSLPSVGLLTARAPAEMSSPEFWLPDNLFGSNLDSLTSAVEILADVPEFSLGLTAERGGLDARRVAGILRDWVTGATLPELVSAWSPEPDQAAALRQLGRYLFSDLTGQVPWGLGALQLLTMTEQPEATEATEARRIPAMAYYGVHSRGAVALRMIGVPRAAAEGLGNTAPNFNSFGAARSWANDLSERAWIEAGSDTGGNGQLLKRIWELVRI